jgi:rod shape-determining protein MreB
MADALDKIARACWSILEQTPPDLAADLLETGITLTGGGALIPGLAGELSVRTNVPTTVAIDPLICVARGAGEILASPSLLERLKPQADRMTRWYQSLRSGMRESYSR